MNPDEELASIAGQLYRLAHRIGAMDYQNAAFDCGVLSAASALVRSCIESDDVRARLEDEQAGWKLARALDTGKPTRRNKDES